MQKFKYEVVISGILDAAVANGIAATIRRSDLPESMTVTIRSIPEPDEDPAEGEPTDDSPPAVGRYRP